MSERIHVERPSETEEERSAFDDACDRIRDELSHGPKEGLELQRSLTQTVTLGTFRRARAKLHDRGEIERTGGGGFGGPVLWSLLHLSQRDLVERAGQDAEFEALRRYPKNDDVTLSPRAHDYAIAREAFLNGWVARAEQPKSRLQPCSTARASAEVTDEMVERALRAGLRAALEAALNGCQASANEGPPVY